MLVYQASSPAHKRMVKGRWMMMDLAEPRGLQNFVLVHFIYIVLVEENAISLEEYENMPSILNGIKKIVVCN